MTQEEKELIIKDLCSRLPYGVKIALKNSDAYHHENVAKKGDITIDKLKGFNGRYFSIYHDNPLDWDWYVSDIDVEDIKPYLFPLSSMTEEQKEELTDELIDLELKSLNDEISHIEVVKFEINYYLKNHLDYMNLIPMGLANDATGLGIY